MERQIFREKQKNIIDILTILFNYLSPSLLFRVQESSYPFQKKDSFLY